MALAVQNEEEDVEAMLKRLGIVVDDRVDACLRFKNLGNMQGAMETLSSWATALRYPYIKLFLKIVHFGPNTKNIVSFYLYIGLRVTNSKIFHKSYENDVKIQSS